MQMCNIFDLPLRGTLRAKVHNKTFHFTMQVLHNLHVQFSGFHFLFCFLQLLNVVRFFRLSAAISQVFGLKYDIDGEPIQKLRKQNS